MKINRIGFNFALYLALIEGISLYVLDFLNAFNVSSSFLVGFVPALIVLLLYKLTWSFLPVTVNDKKVTKFPVLIPSIANGLFIVLLFLIQDVLSTVNGHMFVPMFGFTSVFIAFLILVILYNEINIKYNKVSITKIRFSLNHKNTEVKKLSLLFTVYAGIFEFFILPLMTIFFANNVPSLINGFVSGYIGGVVGLIIVDLIIRKYPFELF